MKVTKGTKAVMNTAWAISPDTPIALHASLFTGKLYSASYVEGGSIDTAYSKKAMHFMSLSHIGGYQMNLNKQHYKMN